jgi:predicted dehydrogenase
MAGCNAHKGADMKRLGVGIVGAGFVTTTFHVQGWTNVRHADIVAICDLDKEKAERTAKKARELRVGDPCVYTDVKDMVNDLNVHAIWIAVPNYARLPVLRAIIEAYEEGNGQLIGIACEKPLARNVKEAQEMIDLIEQTDLLHGYLENQVFAPSVVRGKEILWQRGASNTGRPYLARCAEEHSGPHESWFWSGEKQGGGTLNDMGCHSVEASRFLLTAPGESKADLVPKTVNAEIAALKWIREGYVDQLSEVQFGKFPVEDFGRGSIVYEMPSGELCMAEITVSWNYMGPGLRLSFELQGPEYSMEVNTLNSELQLFLSRRVIGEQGEDLVEKQEAEQGQMPVVSDESVLYGYAGENRHMVQCFLDGRMPDENWYDGLAVVKLLMSLYMSAEKGKRLAYPPKGLDEYVPDVAQGRWDPLSIARGDSE